MQMKKTKAKAIRVKLIASEERQRQSNIRIICVPVVGNPKYGTKMPSKMYYKRTDLK